MPFASSNKLALGRQEKERVFMARPFFIIQPANKTTNRKMWSNFAFPKLLLQRVQRQQMMRQINIYVYNNQR